jgi:hypothetical protein
VSVDLEELLDAALAALDEVSVRELEATGEVLCRRRDGMRVFGQVFVDRADEREGGFGQSRYHLAGAVADIDVRTAARIENATAPFWAHVRDALAERHP